MLTPEEQTEWNYIYHERLGILIDGTREATPQEKEIAAKDADDAIERMKNQPPSVSQ